MLGMVGLSTAAGALGALGGYFGQREANQTNRDIASRQTRASQEMAREQMQFQERMSNSAYQRSIADLDAAGLNPLLALGGGASAPSGSMGSAPITTVQNELSSGVASAAQAAQLAIQTKKAKEELSNLKSDTAKKNAETQATKSLKNLHDQTLELKKQDETIKGPKERFFRLLNKVIDSPPKETFQDFNDKLMRKHLRRN
jgi:Flp pilus assembly protein TadB